MRYLFYNRENDDDDIDGDDDSDDGNNIVDGDDDDNDDEDSVSKATYDYDKSPVCDYKKLLTPFIGLKKDAVLAFSIENDAEKQKTTPRMISRRRLDSRIPASSASGVVYSALSGVSSLAASSLCGAPFSASSGVRFNADDLSGAESSVQSGFSRWRCSTNVDSTFSRGLCCAVSDWF